MKNKGFRIIFACMLVIGALIAAVLNIYAADSSFSDVPSDAYYKDSVDWAVEQGITKGSSDTTFSPDKDCTRAECVTFLYRSAGSPKPNPIKARFFKDVSEGDYFADAVAWAVENRITTGTSAEAFSPRKTCSRGEIVTFLWRFSGQPAEEYDGGFSDVQEGQYYTDSVAWAVKQKITTGVSETAFGPDQACTRAQIVSFLYRMAAEKKDDPAPSEDTGMRGIWLSFNEYAPLGLSILDGEDAYRENADRILAEAKKYKINTVFLHARAFDDAFWRSKTFHASHYVGGDESVTAEEAYSAFDPFGVFLEEAHKYGMEVHAWLNPYRVTKDYYYDPGDEASIDRVLTAVEELLAFESNGEKIDGIHLDDYFYHAAKGYYKLGDPDDKYAVVGSEDAAPESGKYIVVTPEQKRANVNRMVKAIYQTVSEAGSTFGISPAGNYDNDMKDGADIDTWLTEDGYLDYLIPQIYWSNQWGGNADVTMFTDRLDQFLSLKKNDAKLYIGLALCRTEAARAVNDPGWQLKDNNLAEQIKELKRKGADGYVYFSAQYLFRSCAEKELENIRLSQ